MSSVKLLILLFILLFGIVFLQKMQFQVKNNNDTRKHLFKKTQTHTPSPVISKPLEMKEEQREVKQIDRFVYPNAYGVSSSGNTTIFESTDNPTVITEWYKNIIRAEEMVTKTFLSTKSNDTIFNKLIGVRHDQEIQVDIKKPTSQASVTVLVTVINY